jgi:tetratricopeptide (TPR) repeat protein
MADADRRTVSGRPRASAGAAAVLHLTTLALACSTTPQSRGDGAIAPEELLAGTGLGVTAGSAEPVAPETVLALTPEMRAFIDAHVDRGGGGTIKLHQLATSIIDRETFGVTYDDRTRTAAETFRTRRGNCLSFSTMFVAMARDVGLNVQYQEVEIPPDWTLDNDTYVLNQHVNVYVNLDPAAPKVVDFNIADFRASYEMERIPDARALAHFYNNVGVERMQAGDTASALACFRTAIADSDRRFSPAWVNLGTLYLRNGHPAHAEAAYLEALRADRSDLVAMSSLARLYERLGDRERAVAYRKNVVHHRNLNPYYRYELARRAYSAQDWDAAIGHLKYAVRKRPNEDQFCFLLGLSYLQKGNEREARRWFDRAEELAATDALKRTYSRKADTMLRRPAQGHPR